MQIIPNLISHYEKFNIENIDIFDSPILKTYLNTIEIINNCSDKFDYSHAL